MKTKKTTLATIKSFIKREVKNNNLYIKTLSSFDGMIDCVSEIKDDFKKVEIIEEDIKEHNSLGIKGAWFVKQSGDYFQNYADDNFIGYEISNCCGSFILAFKRLY